MADDEFKDGDITPGGSTIIEAKVREEEWTPPESYAENCELIEEHLEPIFGKSETVMHEIISDLIHLDVLIYPPDDKRDFWVYVTSGMGDIRMTTPPDEDPVEWSRAELMIGLPRDWGDRLAKLDDIDDEEAVDSIYWPIGLLKWLARYPHFAETWFGPGHTIPNVEEEPYSPDSRLNGAMISFSTLVPESHSVLTLPDGDHLNFYGLILLYPEEMDFKLKKGAGALADKLELADVSEVIDVTRRSVVRKNPLLRLIGGG